MPKNNARQSHLRGRVEKKKRTDVGRIRGIGTVEHRTVNVHDFCKVSGKLTDSRLVVGKVSIPCRSNLISEGLKVLRQVCRQTA